MLLPNEFIENSIETYIYRYTTSSQRIYWIVLAAVAITLVSLPFIYVDISVQGGGVIRPVAEKTEIKSPVNEIVDSVYVKEGDQVQKGDIILRFRTSSQDYKIAYQSNRLSDYSEQLSDLSYLAKGACPPSFQSPVRRQEYNYYVKRKRELETSLDQAEKEFLRNKALFEKNVLPEEEYDINEVVRKVKEGYESGAKTHHVIVLAEGVMGAEEFAAKMKEAGDTSDLRATNIGHVVRGGSPTARDRVLASWMGAHAVDLLKQGIGGVAVGIHNEELVESPILGTAEEGALFSLTEDGKIIVNNPHKARLDFADLNRSLANLS